MANTYLVMVYHHTDKTIARQLNMEKSLKYEHSLYSFSYCVFGCFFNLLLIKYFLQYRFSFHKSLLLTDRLIVEAKDRGNPALMETCTVQVQVVDVNDNRPVIQVVEPLAVPESKISIRY